MTGGYANDVFLLEVSPPLVLHLKHPPANAEVTHNDIFPGNVLVHEGRVTALLDWEEADIDWLVWDLACGIWPFCDAEDDVNAAAAECLVADRDAGGLVPAAEDDLIIPLIRAKRILEVLRAPTDRHPRWDLQLANLRAYQMLS